MTKKDLPGPGFLGEEALANHPQFASTLAHGMAGPWLFCRVP